MIHYGYDIILLQLKDNNEYHKIMQQRFISRCIKNM